MAQGKRKSATKTPSVIKSWRDGGERAVIEACIQKYAAVIDGTDSGRDMKPLITGMFEAIDRLRAVDAAEAGRSEDTPLGTIVSEAQRILADA